MQVLKDEKKEAILSVSVQEFYQKGFHQVTMRSIAERSGISVGNLYRYFKNKDDILDALLQPVLEKLTVLLNQSKQGDEAHNPGDEPAMEPAILVEYLIQQNLVLVKQLVQHRKELIILMEQSKESKYDPLKKEGFNFFAGHLESHLSRYYSYHLGQPDIRLAEPFSIAFLSAIFTILRTYETEEDILYLIAELIRFFFKGGLELFRYS